jgi:serine/threonine-protein kinase HipA
MADALRRYGSRTVADMRQLWRRIVFNILISNTDDHLRNHGFLYDRARGWRLAPAYDLNPVPVDLKPRILSTAITLDDATASLALALEVAEDFDLTPAQARKIAGEIGAAVSRWRSEAACLGLTARAIERMESAFEHRDLEDAVRGQSTPQSLRRS